MTEFAALAALLAAIALAFLLPPLLRARPGSAAAARDDPNAAIYREQLAELAAERERGALGEEEYRRALRELERRVAAEAADAGAAAPRRPHAAAAIAIGVLLPLFAALGYWKVGTPEALSPQAREAAHPSREQIEGLVERLWEKMHGSPDDAEGWALLARALAALEQHERAMQAFARAVQLEPNDAWLLADYADALAVSRGRRLEGEPLALARRALALEPRHPKALAMVAAGESQAGNHAAAAGYWRQLLELVPPDSDLAQQLKSSLAEAERLAAAAAPEGKAKASRPRALRGVVSLDPKLAALAAPGDTVYVIARAAGDARMPLAVARTTVAALPYRFSLDDSMAMAPGARLSAQKKVVVAARISRSGNPLPQKGDIEGLSAPVAPTASDVRVVIARVIE
jgi:cytochrome c-type biogenesis protein CcmH